MKGTLNPKEPTAALKEARYEPLKKGIPQKLLANSKQQLIWPSLKPPVSTVTTQTSCSMTTSNYSEGWTWLSLNSTVLTERNKQSSTASPRPQVKLTIWCTKFRMKKETTSIFTTWTTSWCIQNKKTSGSKTTLSLPISFALSLSID